MNFIEAIEIGTAIGFAAGIGVCAFVLTVYAVWCLCAWLEGFMHGKRLRAEAAANNAKFRTTDGE